MVQSKEILFKSVHVLEGEIARAYGMNGGAANDCTYLTFCGEYICRKLWKLSPLPLSEESVIR